MKSFKNILAISLVVLLTLLTGCKKKVVDHVAFKISDNLETVRLSLVFDKSLQPNLMGAFPISTYGLLFVNPFASSTPFEVGFDLNTSIVNDQDFIQLKPTLYLPNGIPHGVSYPLVEVKSPKPISNDFDVSAYLDVTKQDWIGAAVTFKFAEHKDFPKGMVFQKQMLQDSQNNTNLFIHVFGAQLNSDGSMKRPGGIAVLANIAYLISTASSHEGQIPVDAEK